MLDADIALGGERLTLLAALYAASTETDTFGLRDEPDGLARSLTVPALRTRGALRARRRPA